MPSCSLIFCRTLWPVACSTFSYSEILQRDSALHQLLSKDLLDRFEVIFAVRCKQNLLVASAS